MSQLMDVTKYSEHMIYVKSYCGSKLHVRGIYLSNHRACLRVTMRKQRIRSSARNWFAVNGVRSLQCIVSIIALTVNSCRYS